MVRSLLRRELFIIFLAKMHHAQTYLQPANGLDNPSHRFVDLLPHSSFWVIFETKTSATTPYVNASSAFLKYHSIKFVIPIKPNLHWFKQLKDIFVYIHINCNSHDPSAVLKYHEISTDEITNQMVNDCTHMIKGWNSE